LGKSLVLQDLGHVIQVPSSYTTHPVICESCTFVKHFM